MNTLALASSILLATLTHAAHAQDAQTAYAIKIEQNGALVASPRIISKDGQTSTIEMGDSLRLELNGTRDAGVADVKLKIFLMQNGALTEASNPRLKSELGKEMSVEMMQDNGQRLKIYLLATTVKPQS
jgi:hypothetical protein